MLTSPTIEGAADPLEAVVVVVVPTAAAAAATAAAADAGIDGFLSDWLRPLTCKVSANLRKSLRYDS